jgi:hypothetical protein
VSQQSKGIKAQYQISSLCTDFTATLHLNPEEGVPRHFVQQLTLPVVVDDRGVIQPIIDRQFAVVMRLKRSTDLLPYMEEDLLRLSYRPAESLYLAVAAGEPLVRARIRLLDEASKLFIDLAEAGALVRVVAISHRREINDSMVIRHYPVAILDEGGRLCWVHPAAHSYGLIRDGFPSSQRVRSLGPRTKAGKTPELLSRLDAETGLPEWYLFAQEHLKALELGEDPVYRAVMDHQVHLLVQRSIVEDAEKALQEATQQFLYGFESFFGQGGLHPVPGRLDYA